MSSTENTVPAEPSASFDHPRAFAPFTFVLLAVLSVLGAIIGIQLLTSLGVTPNTSIIGALAAMIIARVPLKLFSSYRSIHVQNLAQSAISASTFGAANSLLLPIGIPYLFGRHDLILPMFAGVALAMLLDAYLLYRMFDTRVFPASGAWPPGVAAAEAIKAGDQRGRHARLLGFGIALGMAGSWLAIPMSAFGTAFIGNIWALGMFGVGLLTRGYSVPVLGIDIGQAYIPHGVMIGAGLVALIQVAVLVRDRRATSTLASNEPDREGATLRQSFRFGVTAYVCIASMIAFAGGLYAEMSVGMLLVFILYAAVAAFVHELIVGIAAMHSGWFPAFAVALITLLIGMMIGFPPVALALLCGFTAATGPAFADMGYDLKAGHLLRGNGANPALELSGRKQQLYAAMLAFVIAIPVVYLTYGSYFRAGLVPPVDKVYVATIKAGVTSGIAMPLLVWAIPGALLQWIGGPKRQMGVLLATGLLITNPIAGWAVLTGIALRVLITRIGNTASSENMEVFAAGVIAGDAVFSFVHSLFSAHALSVTSAATKGDVS